MTDTALAPAPPETSTDREHVCCADCHHPGPVDYYVAWCGALVDGDEPWWPYIPGVSVVCPVCLAIARCPLCGRRQDISR